MPRSIRSARSNSICSVTSEGTSAKQELLASRMKMGKKVEKGLNKDKNPSATSQDEVDSNKALEPHVCTGNFQVDFTELCRRNNMACIPAIVMRPRPPGAATQPEASPVKGGKDKGKQAQPEPEPEETTEDGEPIEAPPKTFTTKDKFDYFKPCVQVEMDHPDKGETVTEIFIRGWKIDETMMETLKQCWPTMEKLHSIHLWNTALTSTTLSTLASFIPNCHNLKTLILDGNGPVEEQNWFELIGEESPIQNLSLRHCGINDKGAIMLGRCLGSMKRSNTKLLTLNLSNNKIGNAGLEEIAQGLRMNRTLLSLALASNEIGDKGALKLAEVLSRFPLTHEEVVERRRQQSDRGSPDRNKSPPLSRRADSRDRPGSVRSNTQIDKKGKGNEKPSAKGKKDAKGGKEDKEEKHDKGKGKKEKEEKTVTKKDAKSKASIAADAGKGGKGAKGGNKGKTTGKPQTAEHESSDGPEFINPLLEGADFIDGQLWVTGNRVIININLSRNQIGEVGLTGLLRAMEHQQKLDSKTNGTGLMRLLLGKNKLPANHDLINELNDIMLPKDPFYKPPPPTPEGTEA